MESSRSSGGAAWGVAVLAGVGVAYFAAGKLGLSFAELHAGASPVWPPTGIALAAVLLLGRRVWPAIFAGAFLVNATTLDHLPLSLAIAAGNTLEALVGAWLVQRFAGGVRAFDHAPNAFRYVALAGFAATAVSATVGVAALAFAGSAPRPDLPAIWGTWWLGDMGGALLVAPPLLVWGARLGRLGRRTGARVPPARVGAGLLASAVALV